MPIHPWTGDQQKRKKLVTTTHAGGAENNSLPQISDTVDYSAEDILDAIVLSLEDSKAEDLNTINIKGKSALGDYMVIASGRSHRHVGSMADHLLRNLKEKGFGSAKVEGQQADATG